MKTATPGRAWNLALPLAALMVAWPAASRPSSTRRTAARWSRARRYGAAARIPATGGAGAAPRGTPQSQRGHGQPGQGRRGRRRRA